MSTSVTSGPSNAIKISLGTFGYVRARNKQRIYNIIIREFKKSGLRNIDLAKRLGKAPEVVHRLLSRPQNWEADTISDLVFAICGGTLKFSVDRPTENAASVTSIEERRPDQADAFVRPTSPKSNSQTLKAA